MFAAFADVENLADPSHVRRRRQHRRDMDRIRRNLEALVLSHPAVSGLGGNEEIEGLASDLGLEPHDLAVLDVRIKNRRASILCVPSRLWHHEGAMTLFFELKKAAVEHGHSLVLVPQSFVQRQPRLDNVMMISSTVDFDISPGDRMAVLAHLLEHGTATLAELAGAIGHRDPVSAILHLVVIGALEIDLDTRILPVSTLRVAGPDCR